MKIVTALSIVALAFPLSAAQENFGAGAQAAPWLKYPTNARSSALGEAGVALADDVSTASLNPAGLVQLQGQQLSFMHDVRVLDMAVENLAYGLKVGENVGLAAAVSYVNFGSIEKFRVDNNVLVADGSFNPSAFSAGLAAGYGFGSLSAGLNVKLVSESLDGASSASTVAGDLGALWRQGEEGLSLGLALQNLGQLYDTSLPMTTRAGAAYRLGVANGSVALAADAGIPSADSAASVFGAGLEYVGAELYALRAGYKAVGNGGAGGMSLGAGIRYNIIQLDYAFNAVGELGNAHQISALVKF
jgi:hypothetical protein